MPDMGMLYTGECNGQYYTVRVERGHSASWWTVRISLYDHD